VPWRDRLGIDSSGPALIANGAPRFDAAAIRAVLAAGKGRMPAQPHLTNADVDNLVTFLTARGWDAAAQAARRRRCRGARGGAAAGAGAPPELIAGSGSVAPVQTAGPAEGVGRTAIPMVFRKPSSM
jgi:hypothetical protein